jgi:hypothetical protein
MNELSQIVSETKIYTTNEIGASIEDMFNNAEKAEKMHEGAKLILGDAIQQVGALVDTLKQDVSEDKMKIEDFSTISAVQELIIKYVARAQYILENMQLSEKNAQIAATGMSVAYKQSMNAVKRMKDVEQAKLAGLKNVEEVDDVNEDTKRSKGRTIGAHPGNPVAKRMKRLEE